MIVLAQLLSHHRTAVLVRDVESQDWAFPESSFRSLVLAVDLEHLQMWLVEKVQVQEVEINLLDCWRLT